MRIKDYQKYLKHLTDPKLLNGSVFQFYDLKYMKYLITRDGNHNELNCTYFDSESTGWFSSVLIALFY